MRKQNKNRLQHNLVNTSIFTNFISQGTVFDKSIIYKAKIVCFYAKHACTHRFLPNYYRMIHFFVDLTHFRLKTNTKFSQNRGGDILAKQVIHLIKVVFVI
jgi:hypothetical protein